MNSVTINSSFGKRYRRKSQLAQLQSLGWIDEEGNETPKFLEDSTHELPEIELLEDSTHELPEIELLEDDTYEVPSSPSKRPRRKSHLAQLQAFGWVDEEGNNTSKITKAKDRQTPKIEIPKDRPYEIFKIKIPKVKPYEAFKIETSKARTYVVPKIEIPEVIEPAPLAPPEAEPVVTAPPKPVRIKYSKEQKIKGAKYYNLACEFLAKKENKRFGLEVIFCEFLNFYARDTRQNYIGLLTPDTRARNRAYKKFSGANNDRCYKLKSHTDKRGYHKQAWFIGDHSNEVKDLKRAFTGGAEQFYFPPEVYHMAYEIIKELHWAFLYYFDKRPDNRKLNARMAVLADKLINKIKVPGLFFARRLRTFLFSMVSKGRLAWGRNFGFANKIGRPKKVNDTRLALRCAHTTKGQISINKHMTKVSKQVGVSIRNKVYARDMKARLMSRICSWAMKPCAIRAVKLREEAGERLDQAMMLQEALRDITPSLKGDFKKAKKGQVWKRRKGKKRYAQTANNSPPYILLNKYNKVSKEHIAAQCVSYESPENNFKRGVATKFCANLA